MDSHGTVASVVEVVRFVQSLAAAPSLEALERRFVTGFPRLVGADIYGFNVVEPDSGRPRWYTGINVSDAFLARYAPLRDEDPLRARAYGDGELAYNRALMSAREWERCDVYRGAYCVHGIRHVVEAPLRSGGQTVGNLHFGTRARDFGDADLRFAAAIAGVLAGAVADIDERARLRRERDRAAAALELVRTPVVISEPGSPELQLNAAARELLADVDGAQAHLHDLLARPAAGGGFSRRIEVELATGEAATIHGHSLPHHDGALITVLELERERPGIAPALLAPLTPREREVAALVVDGLADREIAARLYLSHHTVSQYVKSIYRKLGVDSRVALTRALLTRRL
jgi:DNA-binding CsgD family transcriptional regulator